MILMREEKSKFLNFIFQEADGDEENTPKNRKVVTVKRKGGRKVDYSKGADLEAPEEETDDTSDSTGNENPDNEATSSEDTTDNADTGEDDGPSMDDTDYSDSDDSSDDTSTDDNSSDTSDGGDDSGGSQASADEQARKYSLYRKFVKLNNLLESNTEVLSNTMFDDTEINQKIKSVTAKLKETNRLLSEYMVVKFQTASYIQSMLFYQRVLAIVDINFNILQDLKKQINKKR